LGNNLGPLPGQVINFLEDAAHSQAVYGASLLSQPTAFHFQGPVSGGSVASQVELTGVAAPSDHFVP
jgi:hypothetical protein